ncbi:MAG: hypothetical protein ACI9HK_005334 [Pirellulaceae bacterium]|jgi:hypothetical protein
MKTIETTTEPLHRVEDLLAGLDELLEENETPAPNRRLSVFLPAGPLPAEAKQAQVHCRNALRRAEELAANTLSGEEDQRPILAVLGDLAEDEEFWKHQQGGVAIFADNDRVRVFEIAHPFEPLTLLSPAWHLTPLLALAANVDACYLLQLSQNTVRLCRGSKLGIRDITPPAMPTSFEESLAAQTEFEADKAALKRFFAEIDRHVSQVLGDSDNPLILAGVDYYLPIYAEVTGYPHFVSDRNVSGNPEHCSCAQLHEAASALLQPEFIEARKNELQKMAKMADGPKVISSSQKILQAGSLGQIRAVMLPSDERCWAHCDDALGEIEPARDESDTSAVDAMQRIAELTLRHGGELFYLQHNQMPKGRWPWAELRF